MPYDSFVRRSYLSLKVSPLLHSSLIYFVVVHIQMYWVKACCGRFRNNDAKWKQTKFRNANKYFCEQLYFGVHLTQRTYDFRGLDKMNSANIVLHMLWAPQEKVGLTELGHWWVNEPFNDRISCWFNSSRSTRLWVWIQRSWRSRRRPVTMTRCRRLRNVSVSRSGWFFNASVFYIWRVMDHTRATWRSMRNYWNWTRNAVHFQFHKRSQEH